MPIKRAWGGSECRAAMMADGLGSGHVPQGHSARGPASSLNGSGAAPSVPSGHARFPFTIDFLDNSPTREDLTRVVDKNKARAFTVAVEGVFTAEGIWQINASVRWRDGVVP